MLIEAYFVYVQKKKEDIIKIADEYRNVIQDYVYDALIKYEFKIENDKNYQKTA